jgi:tetratricopeptide (TPR) repeat protein
MTRLSLAALLAVALVVPASAQTLGETEFENSGAAEAQAPFLRGLLLLHSFEYEDAREAFQEARRIDPDFAMAAWGEAMTHNHPIWMRQDRDAAREALAGVSSGGTTDREAAYLATLDVLYGDGDKEGRDDAYAEAMRGLAEAYPDDLDARAFYALALLGTAHEGRDFSVYMRAAAVAEEVFDENPRHPGAAHYLIHAYDDPVHAPLGLRPARVYADVAPAASHALHMPSHIYLALGMWDEVATMNERSYGAAKAGTDRRGAPLNGHGWHALYWWHYAETQRDDRAAAARLRDLARELYAADPSERALAHWVRIRAHDRLAFGGEAPAPLPLGEPSLTTRSVDAFDRATAALVAGDHDAAQSLRAALAADVSETADPPWQAEATALQLEGLLAAADGDTGRAVELLREAAAVEDAAPLTFGPPTPVVPSHDLLGRMLLDLGRADEAATAFEGALARAPGRRQSAAGLAEARAALDAADAVGPAGGE